MILNQNYCITYLEYAVFEEIFQLFSIGFIQIRIKNIEKIINLILMYTFIYSSHKKYLFTY
jgi:hypothetical protein